MTSNTACEQSPDTSEDNEGETQIAMSDQCVGDPVSMRKTTQLRALLDGFAARYAAIRISEGADPTPMLEHFARMEQAANDGDYDRFIAADRDLHLVIAQLANVHGLPEVWETCRRYWDSFRVGTIRSCYPDLDMLLEAHRPIVRFICSGSCNAAEDAAKAHLDAVWHRLAELRSVSPPAANRLARVCAYLAFHLHESTTLEYLAHNVAHMSAGHLARLFREQCGRSYTDYVRELRMKKAGQLLKTTDQSVSRIARSVAYKDPSRFARHFRRFYGESPTAFRLAAQALSATDDHHEES